MAVHARNVYGVVQRDEVAGECDSGEVRREGSCGGAIQALGARVGARDEMYFSHACLRAPSGRGWRLGRNRHRRANRDTYNHTSGVSCRPSCEEPCATMVW